jgi:hypothetical protein
MSILCLWNPDYRTAEGWPVELTPLLLAEAPRVTVEGRGVVWADLRGLPAEAVGRRIVAALGERRIGGSVGLGSVPIVAEAAARSGSGLTCVPAGSERVYLAGRPLRLLTGDDHLLLLLEGSGVLSCGDLARLAAESVEVRFGSDGTRLWRLARGDDPRILFRPIPPERPHASIDFVDYTVRDATRLVFTLNALLDQLCETLRQRARRARSITLTFTLSGGGTATEVLRAARPTGERAQWVRRLRTVLDGIRLPDSVTGVALEVDAAEPVSALQGDLFDRGFSTAGFVEEAVARLLDLYRGLFVRQHSTPHPLAERRASWVELTPEEAAHGRRPLDLATAVEPSPVAPPGGALELQLLPHPRPIQVRTEVRRDHVLPRRYLEGSRWRGLVAAGPDRISGGHEEGRPYAREYFRCACETGALLWIYRDAIADRWYLQGWWD